MIRMDKEHFKKIVDNSNYIPGIYNYCDRWCERCHFTSRCANYVVGTQLMDEEEEDALEQEVFWEKLSEIFDLTREMIEEYAAEEGIDLDDIDVEEYQREYENWEKETENHPCCRKANEYLVMAGKWFEQAQEIFDEKEHELISQIELEIPNTAPELEAATIQDSIDVIQWYQYQIYVKMKRAVGGKARAEDEDENDLPNDSDGSAKVALIGIDRSIAAWGNLRNKLGGDDPQILDILIQLDRLRRRTEKTFPTARSFIRPGFDE